MIKTRDLKVHLEANGCRQVRQGGKHEIWQGPNGRSSVPRHREIPRTTARAICTQLGAPRIA
jgi:mRNA interferase HicA